MSIVYDLKKQIFLNIFLLHKKYIEKMRKGRSLSESVIGIIADALVIFAYRQVILLSQLYFAMQSYIYPQGKLWQI